MVEKCCPCVFNHRPQRLQFKWDIFAMILLTAHDIVALIICIAGNATVKADHYPPYSNWTLLAVLAMLISNFLIFFLMCELGFRLLEDGPWIGKVVISIIHLAPSIFYIAFIGIKYFIYYMGFEGIVWDDPKKPKHKYDVSVVHVFSEVYGISVFHHIYIVLFVVVSTIAAKLISLCKKKKAETAKATKKVSPLRPGTEFELEIGNKPPFEEIQRGTTKIIMKLDAETRIFTPGSEVKGQFVFEPEQNAAKKISLTCEGCVKLEWTDGGFWSCSKKLKRSVAETFLNVSTTLENSTFSFTIPADAPPSFSCGRKIGGIFYDIGATVDFGEGSPTYIVLSFLVQPNPTSGSPEAGSPVSLKQETRLAPIIPLKRGPIGCTLSMEKTGFNPGDEVSFSVDMYNKSRRPVLRVIADIYSHVHLKDDQGKERKMHKDWCEAIYSGRVKTGATASWDGKLMIPTFIPTTFTLTKNIQMDSFCFRVRMEIQGICEDVLIEVPIAIGNSSANADKGGAVAAVAAKPVAVTNETEKKPAEPVPSTHSENKAAGGV